jgi:hypothetical protein
MKQLPHGWARALTWGLLALPATQLLAQTRDPTQPPAAARAAVAASQTTEAIDEASRADQWQAMQHRMVINGQPYLVERGWLRGVGDRLGAARIEHIEDRAVWLRDEQGLHKLDLFPQVEIQTQPTAPTSLSAPNAPPANAHRRRPAAAALKDKTP